jgi:hypothetical protein
MALTHCLSLEDLFERVRSSHQLTGWFAYLELRDEEEAEKMKALFAER